MKNRRLPNIPLDDDFCEMLNWAVRYAMPRSTYASGDTCNYVRKYYRFLDDRTLICMSRDIAEQFDPIDDIKHGKGVATIDRPNWLRLLEEIDKELEDRHHKERLDGSGCSSCPALVSCRHIIEAGETARCIRFDELRRAFAQGKPYNL